MDFAVSVDHRVKIKESIKSYKYQYLKKTMEHEDDGDTNCNWRTRKIPKGLENLEI